MHEHLSLQETFNEWHGTYRDYVIGFAASLVLTGISFSLVISRLLSGPWLVTTLVFLAMVQAIVQLRYFLHVGQEASPKWETLIFYFMILVLFIIVLGSLWIMYDLDDRVMSNMSSEMPHD